MIIFTFLLFLTSVSAFGESLPDWFLPLREAIYEQKLTSDEIQPLYNEIKNRAESLSGTDRLIMLSRCEYFMGRAYQVEEKKNEAFSHFDRGMTYARNALDLQESAPAWVMLAENLSQACTVRPASYAMANGLNVEKFSKNALKYDTKNAPAQFMIAARWVYAPTPFHNYKRGIEMMNAIQTESNMEKDDMFNVFSSIGYAYMQQKNNAQARIWFEKSLEIYPTNKYIRSLTAKL